MLALRSERVMTFAGPFSPKFIADTFVVSENVGEGGSWETFGFPWEFVVNARARRGRDFGMERGVLVVAGRESEREGLEGVRRQAEKTLQAASSEPL
jgi:hypothetical protein